MLRVSEEQHRCGLRGIGVPSSPALVPGAPDQVEVEARIAALAPELKAPAAAAAVPAPAPVPATVKTTEVSADLRVRVAETDLLTYPDLSVDRTRGVQCIRRLEPVDSPQLGGEIEYPGRDGQRFVESELGLVRGAQGRVTEADRLHHAFEAYQVGDARRVAEARRCERGLGRLLAKSRSLHAIDQDARVEMDLHPSPIIPPAGSLLGELSVDLLSRKQPIGVAGAPLIDRRARRRTRGRRTGARRRRCGGRHQHDHLRHPLGGVLRRLDLDPSRARDHNRDLVRLYLVSPRRAGYQIGADERQRRN